MSSLIKTYTHQVIWDAIEKRIEAQAIDGISATREYSELLAESQRSLIKGLRMARLAAIKSTW